MSRPRRHTPRSRIKTFEESTKSESDTISARRSDASGLREIFIDGRAKRVNRHNRFPHIEARAPCSEKGAKERRTDSKLNRYANEERILIDRRDRCDGDGDGYRARGSTSE
ncbi:hypothetical protein EVAR_22763_1 [Eumeta japonica]|uniref:Uncharacterized protein n=1 Tax=Eumeta variegata TaxID=151549 RepID=A0A4C1UT34_EUMVA|nr:hypothetical protein EVAR_22763_1 [Eumeta japonica]